MHKITKYQGGICNIYIRIYVSIWYGCIRYVCMHAVCMHVHMYVLLYAWYSRHVEYV